jgi:hypothetical protein
MNTQNKLSPGRFERLPVQLQEPESDSSECEHCKNKATYTVAGHKPGGNVRWQYDCCDDHLPPFTAYMGKHRGRIRNKCVGQHGYFIYSIPEHTLIGTFATA